MFAEELVRGRPTDRHNPFFYDILRLNLPGDPTYDPTLPRVFKVDSSTGRLAADMVTYVDDVRNTGSSSTHCWQTSHRISTMFCYLGIQDALRKRTLPSLIGGAWTGSIAQSRGDQVIVTCTAEKWERAREYVLAMQNTLEHNSVFHHKTLEKQRGFLVYVARTYPSLVPYLKGIHLTLDSWRGGRDSEGWKVFRQVAAHLDESLPVSASKDTSPEFVTAVPRLSSDIKGLLHLFQHESPPIRVVRSRQVISVLYGFGDASGAGFGDTFLTPQGITYRYGLWGDNLHAKSSNFRELFNLTEAMEAQVADLRFPNLEQLVTTFEVTAAGESWLAAEIFLFTDNAVAESAFYKGTSSNQGLFNLVLRLRQLELQYSLRLHLLHVSGRRMQVQGTDHLSRGVLHTGVLGGASMLEFIPLHLSALDRAPAVLSWCQSWLPPVARLLPLLPRDWFFAGQGLGLGRRNLDGVWQPQSVFSSLAVSLWTPPPGAADAAVEQLAFSRHKRPGLAHIFICPRLMTHLWRKRLHKTADVVFALPAGHRPSAWPLDMFEPLIVGICLPFLPTPPWSCRLSPTLLEVAGQLSGLRSCPERDERVVLRQLWDLSGGAF